MAKRVTEIFFSSTTQNLSKNKFKTVFTSPTYRSIRTLWKTHPLISREGFLLFHVIFFHFSKWSAVKTYRTLKNHQKCGKNEEKPCPKSYGWVVRKVVVPKVRQVISVCQIWQRLKKSPFLMVSKTMHFSMFSGFGFRVPIPPLF